jgi:hypothetical protein
MGFGGFNTPAGNPLALRPSGGYFGSTGSASGGGINPQTGQPLSPEDAAAMEGITPGSAEWNNAFAPAGNGAPTDYSGGDGSPMGDLASVSGSTAQPAGGGDPWSSDLGQFSY